MSFTVRTRPFHAHTHNYIWLYNSEYYSLIRSECIQYSYSHCKKLFMQILCARKKKISCIFMYIYIDNNIALCVCVVVRVCVCFCNLKRIESYRLGALSASASTLSAFVKGFASYRFVLLATGDIGGNCCCRCRCCCCCCSWAAHAQQANSVSLCVCVYLMAKTHIAAAAAATANEAGHGSQRSLHATCVNIIKQISTHEHEQFGQLGAPD